jgi:transposase InsO family protein
VTTFTFKTPYVLVFIADGRREPVRLNVTTNPTAAWVGRQLIEATAWGTRPRHLRDRDAVYGPDFRQRAKRVGIDAITTPVRSPRANTIAVRLMSTWTASNNWSFTDSLPPVCRTFDARERSQRCWLRVRPRCSRPTWRSAARSRD